MARRLRLGDVLEVQLADGLAYLLFIGTHEEYGDAVSVSLRVATQRPPLDQALFDGSYVTFYPARAALTQGLVTVVGSLPYRPLPRRLRRPGARSDHAVDTWIIEDESGETVTRTLTSEQRLIPIAAIWNHALLVERIAQGWRPEREH